VNHSDQEIDLRLKNYAKILGKSHANIFITAVIDGLQNQLANNDVITFVYEERCREIGKENCNLQKTYLGNEALYR
jgi:hypothetical protein